MVQKILRTMQDDLKEAKERRLKGVPFKEEEREPEPKTAQTDPATLQQSTVQKSEEPTFETKKETPVLSDLGSLKLSDLNPSIKEEDKEEDRKNDRSAEIQKKPEPEKEPAPKKMPEPPISAPIPTPAPTPIKKELPESPSIEKKTPLRGKSNQDEELSSLIKRVSASMAGIKPESAKKEVPAPPKKPVKDQELKDLIARMSQNLEKEKEILQEEKKKTAETVMSAVPKAAPKIELSTLGDTSSQANGQKEQGDDSYWEKLHSTLKKTAPSAPQQTMEEIKRPMEKPMPIRPTEKKEESGSTQNTPDISDIQTSAKPESITPTKPAATVTAPENAQNSEGTGLIVPHKEPAPQTQEQEEVRKKLVFKNANDSYISPESRLIFGKQEYYSSLHKRVKPSAPKATDLTSFENTIKEKEIQLSDEEEKKMLRHQIITKYKVKLFSLPWAKIVIFTVLFLGTLGGSLYVILPKLVPPQEAPVEIVSGESISTIDQKVSQKISAKQQEVNALNYFDSELDPWKSLKDQSIARLEIDYDNHQVMLSRDEAMKLVLGENNFYNIPENVLKIAGQKYDILAFKNNGVLRLGIVMQFDQRQETALREEMLTWGKSDIRDKKMYNIMKTLFAGSKITDKNYPFQPATYNGTEINYMNLPDTSTSMDYFFYNDLIIFTTSKDTSFEMIDLLNG